MCEGASASMVRSAAALVDRARKLPHMRRTCRGRPSPCVVITSGGEGTRTLDLRLAKPPLFQLSYTPGGRAILRSGMAGT